MGNLLSLMISKRNIVLFSKRKGKNWTGTDIKLKMFPKLCWNKMLKERTIFIMSFEMNFLFIISLSKVRLFFILRISLSWTFQSIFYIIV